MFLLVGLRRHQTIMPSTVSTRTSNPKVKYGLLELFVVTQQKLFMYIFLFHKNMAEEGEEKLALQKKLATHNFLL